MGEGLEPKIIVSVTLNLKSKLKAWNLRPLIKINLFK